MCDIDLFVPWDCAVGEIRKQLSLCGHAWGGFVAGAGLFVQNFGKWLIVRAFSDNNRQFFLDKRYTIIL